MGRRTLFELLHLVAGVIGTGVFASLSAWSVPNARDAIWSVAWASMAVVIFMGIRPLRKAWAEDHGRAPEPDATIGPVDE